MPAALEETMVAAVVSAFYAKARQDELIGPVFNRVVAVDHWPQHIQTITDFWSSMMLGPRRYSGRPMPKHIAIPELGDAHFQRWLTLFRQTVEELCPPQKLRVYSSIAPSASASTSASASPNSVDRTQRPFARSGGRASRTIRGERVWVVEPVGDR